MGIALVLATGALLPPSASAVASCKNRPVASDVYLIDATAITCASALTIAKKWLAATGYTFGLDDPPRDGETTLVAGYRCVHRDQTKKTSALRSTTTCTSGKRIIHIGLGSGGRKEGKYCNLADSEITGLGPTYVTNLRVERTTCAEGKRVVKAFHSCRYANGGISGRCVRNVLKYRCKEGTRSTNGPQFDALVTCTHGAKKIWHRYQQNV